MLWNPAQLVTAALPLSVTLFLLLFHLYFTLSCILLCKDGEVLNKGHRFFLVPPSLPDYLSPPPSCSLLHPLAAHTAVSRAN